MPLSTLELNIINLRNKAIPGKKYPGDNGRIYVGTKEGRLRLESSATEVTFSETSSIEESNVQDAIENLSNNADSNAQDAVGSILTDSYTIDFTYNSAIPSITADVIDSSITYTKIQDVTASRLLGRATATLGVTEEIILGTGLSFSGTTLNVSGVPSVTITDDLTTNATMYPVWVTANTGALPLKVTSTKLSFNPSTGSLTSTGNIVSPQLYGSSVANGDITIDGTSDVTKTTSYVVLQPSGGNVGVGTSTPTSLFSVASGSLFQVDSNGDVIKLKNVTYSFPSSNASGVLQNNGSGTLTWGAYGITTLAAIGSTPNANGMTLSGNTLNLEPASTSFGGVITTGTQSFTGTKTFNGLTGFGASPTHMVQITNTTSTIRAFQSSSTITGAGTAFVSAGTFVMDITPTSDISTAYATTSTITHRGTQSNTSSTLGIQGHQTIANNSATSGTLTNWTGNYVNVNNSSTGTITNLNCHWIGTSQNSSGTVTNWYGVRIEAQTVGSSLTAGYHSNIASASTRYNLYMVGTAQNYLAGNLGIGQTTPTAYLHIKAGTATASTAPIKLTAGTILTTPEAGALETNSGNQLYYSTSTTTESRGFVEVTRYVAKTSNYTLTANDWTVDCTSGTFAVTLPTAVGITGRTYNIKNSGTGVITINTTGGQTVDDQISGYWTLGASSYANMCVQSDGTNWIIL